MVSSVGKSGPAGCILCIQVPRQMPPPESNTFADQFTPKLVSVLREGYGRAQLTADALAALTVAIVALPLSMAIAIASGVEPERGLYAAVRSEEHTSELQSRENLVCRLLLEKKNIPTTHDKTHKAHVQ